MDYKAIISGRLEFASRRSMEQAVKMMDHLMETRYKGEAIFRGSEEIFDLEQCVVIIPRHISQCQEKTWLNTVHLLKQVTQYAIAGDLNLFKIEPGKLNNHLLLEPKSDKTAVQAYQEGSRLLEDSGRAEEARASLSRAIQKFARHAKALERRGYANVLLGDTEAARRDYEESLHVDDKRPEAYLGLAKLAMQAEEWEKAIVHLQKVAKHAIPHQPIYWSARCLQAECKVELGQYEAAAKDYQLFLKRSLPTGHPMANDKRRAAYRMGRALAAAGLLEKAISAFDQARELPAADGQPTEGEILLHRGLAIQQTGQAGFMEDWKKAADQGSERAAELLASVN